MNPAGTRADGQISNNAEVLNYEWDGIWDARTRITEEGWVAEIVVPFKSLRFKPGQGVWGFNVERQIKRLQEHDRWGFALGGRAHWLRELLTPDRRRSMRRHVKVVRAWLTRDGRTGLSLRLA